MVKQVWSSENASFDKVWKVKILKHVVTNGNRLFLLERVSNNCNKSCVIEVASEAASWHATLKFS